MGVGEEVVYMPPLGLLFFAVAGQALSQMVPGPAHVAVDTGRESEGAQFSHLKLPYPLEL